MYTTSEKAHGVREVQGPVQNWKMKSKDERKADNVWEKREIKLSLIMAFMWKVVKYETEA